MIYHYRDKKTGETFELDYPMSEGGPWEVEHEGRKLVRDDFGATQVGRKDRTRIARDSRGNRQGNDSLPINWPYAKKHDKQGRVVFDSERERREAHARAAADGELLTARELSQPGKQTGMIAE